MKMTVRLAGRSDLRLVTLIFLLFALDMNNEVFADAALNGEEDDAFDIGRIFMTVREREELDRMRRLPQPAVVTPASRIDTSAPAVDSAKAGTDPLGYILPSNGSAYEWIDGDFHKTSEASPLHLPAQDNMKIVRHRNADLTPADEETPAAPEINSDVTE